MPPARSTTGRGSRVKWKRFGRGFAPDSASAFMKSSSAIPYRTLAEITVQNIGGDAFHHRVAAQQSRHPLAASGVKHLALAAPEIDDHAIRIADLFQVLVTGVAIEHIRNETAVLVAEELVLDRQEVSLLDLARHAHRQDLKSLGRSAGCGRIRPAVADLIVEAVDLIAVDVAVGAKQITVEKSGVCKRPVLRPVDGEATHAARRAAAPSCIDAIGRIQAK